MRRFRHVARLQRAFDNLELGGDGFAVTNHLEMDPGADANLIERPLQAVNIFQRNIIGCDDNVATQNDCPGSNLDRQIAANKAGDARRTVRLDCFYDEAFADRQIEGLPELMVDQSAVNAEPWPHQAPLFDQ